MDEEDEDLTSVNSYGRKTWNREAYAKLAQTKKQQKHEPSSNEKKDITKRKINLNFQTNLNKVQFTNQTTGHKGQSSGFYCEICNLTFKDNLSFLNHINSTKHLERSEFSTKNLKEITIEDVRKKLKSVYEDQLKQLEKENDLKAFDLRKRIEKRKQFELEKKKKKKKQKMVVSDSNDNDNDLMKQMGFNSFGGSNK